VGKGKGKGKGKERGREGEEDGEGGGRRERTHASFAAQICRRFQSSWSKPLKSARHVSSLT
jgi:hypothetical protein